MNKLSGDPGHPVQYDVANQNWFIHTNRFSEIHEYIIRGEGADGEAGDGDGDDFISTFLRKPDTRNLDDKVYRLRYVIPKESNNAKPPTPGYVIQSSSTTGVRNNDDFTLNTISIDDYEYNRNTRFISNCEQVGDVVQVATDKPHNLSVGDKIKVSNITSTNNPTGSLARGFNGEYRVLQIRDARNFDYDITDVNGFTRDPGVFTNDVNDRTILLPRFERKDNGSNIFVYRVEQITEFASGIRDGIYHLFCVNGGNRVDDTFTERTYNQPIEDFYPQLDLDNIRQNPSSTTTFAARAPLGRTFIDDLQNSLTRETIDKLYLSGNRGVITDVSVVEDLPNDTQRRLITLDRVT